MGTLSEMVYDDVSFFMLPWLSLLQLHLVVSAYMHSWADDYSLLLLCVDIYLQENQFSSIPQRDKPSWEMYCVCADSTCLSKSIIAA